MGQDRCRRSALKLPERALRGTATFRQMGWQKIGSPLFMVGSTSASLVVLASERQDLPRQEAPFRRRDMDARAGMPAGLSERSMEPGDGWEVSDVWLEERGGAQDELHAGVAHRKGQAAECPVCYRKCGTCGTRERTWRHLGIWQYETIVRCAVPRADCPEDGVHARRMPWEVRPSSRFTALFEAQAIVMALSGMAVTAMAHLVHETDTRIWRLLGKAVSEARDAADCSDAVRVGTGGTARRRGQSCIGIMAGLDGQRAIAVTGGRDRGAVGRLCDGLEGHGGDRTKVQEVARDMAEACSLGVAAEMPQAAQTVDRFHVVQLLDRATGHVRCAERRESAGKRRQLAGTKCVWLKRKESLTERQLAKREELDPAETHLRTARACQMGEALHKLVPGRAELRRPVGPQRCKGLQEHRLFQDDDLPPAGPPGLHGPEEAGMRYPLETSKSQKIARTS